MTRQFDWPDTVTAGVLLLCAPKLWIVSHFSIELCCFCFFLNGNNFMNFLSIRETFDVDKRITMWIKVEIQRL